jgi:hypothetical protein
MNYQRIYENIINNSKNRKLNGYSEKHHIIPKSLGGDDTKNNIAILTAKEHLICHKILVKIYPGPKMVRALSMMLRKNRNQTKRIISSRDYETLRKERNRHIKGKKLEELYSEEGVSNIKKAQKNKVWKHTEEYKKRLSEKLKGKSYEERFGKEKANTLKELRKNQKLGSRHTKETKLKISATRIGKSSWNKGLTMNENTKEKLRYKQKISRKTCIYCGLTTNPGNISRYHNVKCKHKT